MKLSLEEYYDHEEKREAEQEVVEPEKRLPTVPAILQLREIEKLVKERENECFRFREESGQ